MIVYALSVGDVLRGPPVFGDNCPSHCIGDPIRIYRLESRPVRVGPVVTAAVPTIQARIALGRSAFRASETIGGPHCRSTGTDTVVAPGSVPS